MSKRTDPEQDLQRLLDKDAGEFGSIYRRLAQAEPSRRLDRVVLANAARAVHGGRAPRAQRWALGLGSAAGIVLAAGIAWQVGQQLDSRNVQPRDDRGNNAVIPVEPITESRRERKPELDAPKESIEDREMAAADAQATAAPAAPARRKAVAPPAARVAAPPPAPTPAAELQERVLQGPRPAAAMPASAEAEPFAKKQDMESKEGLSATTEARQRSEDAAQEAGDANSASAPAAAMGQSRAPSPSSSIKLRRNMHLAPQDWLAEIVRLNRAGQRQEAIENLRLFRRMHPDWQLSDELLRLAE